MKTPLHQHNTSARMLSGLLIPLLLCMCTSVARVGSLACELTSGLFSCPGDAQCRSILEICLHSADPCVAADATTNHQALARWCQQLYNTRHCPIGFHRCSSQTRTNLSICVSPYHVCDGVPDCSSHTDELLCHSRPRLCPRAYFRCEERGQCVPQASVCGSGGPSSLGANMHCRDGSDRGVWCMTRTCPSHTFPCGAEVLVVEGDARYVSQCLPYEFVCETQSQCPRADVLPAAEQQCVNGWDEGEHCSGLMAGGGWCPAGYAKCPRSRRCLKDTGWCNGLAECPGGSDEEGCDQRLCPPTYHSCTSGDDKGRCLEASLVCDGFPHCLLGSDENQCMNHTCGNGWFRCSGFTNCIALGRVCDGVMDCRDGEDEGVGVCNRTACHHHHTCSNNGTCVHTSPDHVQCVCDAGFDGKYCEVEKEISGRRIKRDIDSSNSSPTSTKKDADAAKRTQVIGIATTAGSGLILIAATVLAAVIWHRRRRASAAQHEQLALKSKDQETGSRSSGVVISEQVNQTEGKRNSRGKDKSGIKKKSTSSSLVRGCAERERTSQYKRERKQRERSSSASAPALGKGGGLHGRVPSAPRSRQEESISPRKGGKATGYASGEGVFGKGEGNTSSITATWLYHNPHTTGSSAVETKDSLSQIAGLPTDIYTVCLGSIESNTGDMGRVACVSDIAKCLTGEDIFTPPRIGDNIHQVETVRKETTTDITKSHEINGTKYRQLASREMLMSKTECLEQSEKARDEVFHNRKTEMNFYTISQDCLVEDTEDLESRDLGENIRKASMTDGKLTRNRKDKSPSRRYKNATEKKHEVRRENKHIVTKAPSDILGLPKREKEIEEKLDKSETNNGEIIEVTGELEDKTKKKVRFKGIEQECHSEPLQHQHKEVLEVVGRSFSNGTLCHARGEWDTQHSVIDTERSEDILIGDASRANFRVSNDENELSSNSNDEIGEGEAGVNGQVMAGRIMETRDSLELIAQRLMQPGTQQSAAGISGTTTLRLYILKSGVGLCPINDHTLQPDRTENDLAGDPDIDDEGAVNRLTETNGIHGEDGVIDGMVDKIENIPKSGNEESGDEKSGYTKTKVELDPNIKRVGVKNANNTEAVNLNSGEDESVLKRNHGSQPEEDARSKDVVNKKMLMLDVPNTTREQRIKLAMPDNQYDSTLRLLPDDIQVLHRGQISDLNISTFPSSTPARNISFLSCATSLDGSNNGMEVKVDSLSSASSDYLYVADMGIQTSFTTYDESSQTKSKRIMENCGPCVLCCKVEERMGEVRNVLTQVSPGDVTAGKHYKTDTEIAQEKEDELPEVLSACETEQNKSDIEVLNHLHQNSSSLITIENQMISNPISDRTICLQKSGAMGMVRNASLETHLGTNVEHKQETPAGKVDQVAMVESNSQISRSCSNLSDMSVIDEIQNTTSPSEEFGLQSKCKKFSVSDSNSNGECATLRVRNSYDKKQQLVQNPEDTYIISPRGGDQNRSKSNVLRDTIGSDNVGCALSPVNTLSDLSSLADVSRHASKPELDASSDTSLIDEIATIHDSPHGSEIVVKDKNKSGMKGASTTNDRDPTDVELVPSTKPEKIRHDEGCGLSGPLSKLSLISSCASSPSHFSQPSPVTSNSNTSSDSDCFAVRGGDVKPLLLVPPPSSRRVPQKPVALHLTADLPMLSEISVSSYGSVISTPPTSRTQEVGGPGPLALTEEPQLQEERKIADKSQSMPCFQKDKWNMR